MSTRRVSAREVIARRRRERDGLLREASNLVDGLDPGLGVTAVVVFGSVARGDFHEESDIDVLVVAARLPLDPRDRLRLLGDWPVPLEPVVWTPVEYRGRRSRGDPIAVEAEADGVWLRGGPAAAAGTGQ